MAAMNLPLSMAGVFARSAAVFLVSLYCAALARAQADDAPSVTPYRPSVSTPAALSAPGYLEFELGGLRERASTVERRDSLPYAVKLAFGSDWGARIGGEAWVAQTDSAAQRSTGTGDTSLVLKHSMAIDESSAFGFELGRVFASGAPGVGSGSAAYSVNGIYSADLGVFHADVNLLANRADATGPGVSHLQTLWAASLSRPLGERWGFVGEFSGTNQHGGVATTQFLLAATRIVSRSLVLDAGMARALRSGAPDASAFMGFTLLGPRLF
jgi:hypothetical protein